MRKLIPLVLAISVIAPFATKAQDVREANFQFKQDNYPTALKLYLPARSAMVLKKVRKG